MTDSTASPSTHPANPSQPQTDLVALVASIARALVDSPELVTIENISDGDTTILRLHLGAGDIGKVIGRQGRTARSLRTILAAASMKAKRRYTLDIVEDL